MNKRIARYGGWFYLITISLSFIFPEFFFGNTILIIIELLVYLTFIYFMFFWNTKKGDNHIAGQN